MANGDGEARVVLEKGGTTFTGSRHPNWLIIPLVSLEAAHSFSIDSLHVYLHMRPQNNPKKKKTHPMFSEVLSPLHNYNKVVFLLVPRAWPEEKKTTEIKKINR